LRFFQPHQYISVDYGRQDVLVFSVGKPAAVPATTVKTATREQLPGLMDAAELAAARQMFSGAAVLAQSGISMTKPPVAQEEPLKAELKAFLKAVKDRSRPEVSLEEGRRALELGLGILQRVDEHARKFGLSGLG
jgi:predicted dehydrogenase